MTLLIALMLLELTGNWNPLAIFGVILLWFVHLMHYSVHPNP